MSEKAETEEKKDTKSEDTLSKLLMVGGPPEPEMRSMSIIGDVTEEASKDILAALWFLNHTAKIEEPTNPEAPEWEETKEVIKPFEVIISTNGGNADDMMSIYDMMRLIRRDVDVETTGIGKVMSAGTLLLASGTKGRRRIGRNCRVMIHAVTGGSIGPMHELTNEFKEIKKIQESYIDCLAEETNMTSQQIKKYLKQKTNVYLTAEEAIKLGIADEIF